MTTTLTLAAVILWLSLLSFEQAIVVVEARQRFAFAVHSLLSSRTAKQCRNRPCSSKVPSLSGEEEDKSNGDTDGEESEGVSRKSLLAARNLKQERASFAFGKTLARTTSTDRANAWLANERLEELRSNALEDRKFEAETKLEGNREKGKLKRRGRLKAKTKKKGLGRRFVVFGSQNATKFTSTTPARRELEVRLHQPQLKASKGTQASDPDIEQISFPDYTPNLLDDDFVPDGDMPEDFETYRLAAEEYWKRRLRGQKGAATPAALRRLLGVAGKHGVLSDDPLLDLRNVDAALRDLASALPPETTLLDAAKLASRYPRVLRIASTAKGKQRIVDNVKRLYVLLPWWSRAQQQHFEGNEPSATSGSSHMRKYVDVFTSRLPPTLLTTTASHKLERGSALDRRIDFLAEVFFPTQAEQLKGSTKECLERPRDEWEKYRAKAVEMASSLLRYTEEKLRRNYNDLPRSLLGTTPRDATLTEKQTAAKILKVNPGLLPLDPSIIERRRNAMKKLLPGCNVLSLIQTTPRLLSADVESIIPGVLQSLRRTLPSNVDAELLIRKSPSLLLSLNRKGLTVDTVLSRRLERLASTLGNEDILAIRAIEANAKNTGQEGSKAGRLSAKSIFGSQSMRQEKRRGSIAGSSVKTVLVRDPSLLEKVDKKKSSVCTLEQKLLDLASVLGLSAAEAKTMIRRAPTLAGMNIKGTFRRRCADLCLLFQCDHETLKGVVKREPSLLSSRLEKLQARLMQLELILNYSHELQIGLDPLFSIEITNATIAIARRVPTLLLCRIEDTLLNRAVSLRYLLLGGDSQGRTRREEEDAAFVRVVNRCPELLLYDIEATVAPKLEQLNELLPLFDFTTSDGKSSLLDEIGSREPGARLALREPRLLQYDVRRSLLPKANIWRDRVNDAAPFDALLTRYPMLLMYGFGSAGRLEYFAYCNDGRKPNVGEARDFIMLGSALVDGWGTRGTDRIENEEFDPPKLKRKEKMLRLSSDVVLSYREWLALRLCRPEIDPDTVIDLESVSEQVKSVASALSGAQLEKLYGTSLHGDELAKQSLEKFGTEQAKSPLENLRDQLVERANRDELSLRSFATSNRAARLAEVLPTVNTEMLIAERPQIFLVDSSLVELRVANLRRLVTGMDIGSMVNETPELLDCNIDFDEIQGRFSDLLDVLAPATYESVGRAVSKQPKLLSPLSTPSREVTAAKIAYMLKIVGESQQQALIQLFLRQPDLLLSNAEAICRLEYLNACSDPEGPIRGGDINREKKESVPSMGLVPSVDDDRKAEEVCITDEDDNDVCFVVGGNALPPLQVGQVPAVIRRGSRAMVARHPFYDLYVKERLKDLSAARGSAAEKWTSLEEGERRLGGMILTEALELEKPIFLS